MSRRSFVVEKKTFAVSFSKDVVEVEVGQKSRTHQVSAGVEVRLIKWFMQKVKALLEGDLRIGFVGSKKGKNWM